MTVVALMRAMTEHVDYNYTGAAGKCFDQGMDAQLRRGKYKHIDATNGFDGQRGWGYQTCTEVFQPMPTNGIESHLCLGKLDLFDTLVIIVTLLPRHHGHATPIDTKCDCSIRELRGGVGHCASPGVGGASVWRCVLACFLLRLDTSKFHLV